MPLFFEEIQTPDLSSDLSRLSEVSLEALWTELRGPHQREVWVKLQMDTLAAAQSGQGAVYDDIPTPFEQTDDECQTMALINGIRAVDADYRLASASDVAEFVTRVRAFVRQEGLRGETGSFDPTTGSTQDTRGHLLMSTVAAMLPRLGVPLKRKVAPANPIQVTKTLFAPKRFMGVGKAATWHGKTIVPLAYASAEEFTAELDSLTGAKKIMTLQQFLQVTLNRDGLGGDTFEIYEI